MHSEMIFFRVFVVQSALHARFGIIQSDLFIRKPGSTLPGILFFISYSETYYRKYIQLLQYLASLIYISSCTVKKNQL